VVRKIAFQKVVKVGAVDNAFATPVADEPAATLLSGDSVEQKAQHVLSLAAHFLPSQVTVPAHDPVKVEGVRAYSVESPSAPRADVIASEHEYLLDRPFVERSWRLLGAVVVVLLHVRVGRQIAFTTLDVTTTLRWTPGPVRVDREVVHGHGFPGERFHARASARGYDNGLR
jgi:hypothetical protein